MLRILATIRIIIKTKKMRCAGIQACLKEKMNAYKILVGNPRANIQLWRPWNRWKALDGPHLAQDKDQWHERSGTIRCSE